MIKYTYVQTGFGAKFVEKAGFAYFAVGRK